jgi:hypothetical protein
MKHRGTLYSFLENQQAVSEEFTVLPALTVVMIGFVLFISLIAHAYTTYAQHKNQMQNYQIAEAILQKLTNPNSEFIQEEGVVNLSRLHTCSTSLQDLGKQYERSGIFFLLRISWNTFTEDFLHTLPNTTLNRIAVSKTIGVYLNEAQTNPGTLTLVLWREHR